MGFELGLGPRLEIRLERRLRFGFEPRLVLGLYLG